MHAEKMLNFLCAKHNLNTYRTDSELFFESFFKKSYWAEYIIQMTLTYCTCKSLTDTFHDYIMKY